MKKQEQVNDIFGRDTYQVRVGGAIMWQGPASDENWAYEYYAWSMGYTTYREMLIFLVDPMSETDLDDPLAVQDREERMRAENDTISATLLKVY